MVDGVELQAIGEHCEVGNLEDEHTVRTECNGDVVEEVVKLVDVSHDVECRDHTSLLLETARHVVVEETFEHGNAGGDCLGDEVGCWFDTECSQVLPLHRRDECSVIGCDVYAETTRVVGLNPLSECVAVIGEGLGDARVIGVVRVEIFRMYDAGSLRQTALLAEEDLEFVAGSRLLVRALVAVDERYVAQVQVRYEPSTLADPTRLPPLHCPHS